MDEHSRHVAAVAREAERVESLITQALLRHDIHCSVETLHDPTGDAVSLVLVLSVEDMKWLADVVRHFT